MKIGVTSFYYGSGYGQGLCVKRLSEELAKAGHGVEVFHSSREYGNSKQKNLKLNYLSSSGVRGLEFLEFGLKLNNALKEKDFDLLYAHSPEFGLVKNETPFVYHARGTAKGISFHKGFFSRNLFFPLWEKLDRKCSSNAGKIIADSTKVKNEITRFYGIPDEKILVLPDGTDLKKTGKKTAGKRVLFAGRIVPQKGLHFAVEAFPKVLEKFPEAELLVLGGGGWEKKLKAGAQRLNLSEKIVFAGYKEQEEIAKYIDSADVVLCPSTYEPFGIISLEAAAMGKPVVCSHNVGATEFLGEAVRKVNPKNSGEFAEAIIQSFSGKKKSSADFSVFEWKNLAKEVESILQEALR